MPGHSFPPLGGTLFAFVSCGKNQDTLLLKALAPCPEFVGNNRMVIYDIDQVCEGMIIAESVFDRQGNLLIAGGFRIAQSHIALLRQRGFSSIPIAVEGTEGIVPENVISKQTELELAAVLDKSTQSISAIIAQSRQATKEIHEVIEKGKAVVGKLIRDAGILTVVGKIIEDISQEPWTVVNLVRMQTSDANLLDHSIAVTVLALCIGHKYHFTSDEMRQLGLGALNYDLGMLAVSPEILKKEGPLTEDEKKLIQQHTTYGYLMLTENPEIPATSSIIALAHHENLDGSGYPRKQSAENRPPVKSLSKTGQIHRFAQIVAVADAYEMFVHGRRHFHERLAPLDATKKLIELAGVRLNADVVKTIMSIIPVFPVGAHVRVIASPVADLEGAIAAVSKVNAENLAAPQITIFESKNRQRLSKPLVVELSKHKGFVLELVR
jgi:HD-GYP domain-containing protein (c-di-GMP phosphodiesterase class II)